MIDLNASVSVEMILLQVENHRHFKSIGGEIRGLQLEGAHFDHRPVGQRIHLRDFAHRQSVIAARNRPQTGEVNRVGDDLDDTRLALRSRDGEQTDAARLQLAHAKLEFAHDADAGTDDDQLLVIDNRDLVAACLQDAFGGLAASAVTDDCRFHCGGVGRTGSSTPGWRFSKQTICHWTASGDCPTP